MIEVKLSNENLQALFPFHFMVSGNLEILSTGRSISKLSNMISPGKLLSDYFKITYNGNKLSNAEIFSDNNAFVLEENINAFRLNAQCVKVSESVFLIVCLPLVDHTFNQQKFNLTLSDFAQYDNTVNQLFLAQVTKKTLDDATSINEKLVLKNRELQKTKERFELVVNSVHDIIFQTDGDGLWTFLNKAWEDIMEFSLEESIGSMFFSYLHPDDVQRNQELFLPLINREKAYCAHQIRYVAKSGKVKCMKVFAILTFDEAGNVNGTTGTLQDITMQKENAEKYELLANNVSDVVCIYDMLGSYVYVSPSVKFLIGFSAEELMGKHVLDFLDTKEFNSFEQLKAAMLDSKSHNKVLEHHIRTKDGKWRIIETSSRIIFDENSRPVNFISSSRLIEKRKRAENAIINALKDAQDVSNLKSKFISLVSHEMKTPMTSIYSGVEIMEMKAQRSNQIDQTFFRQFDIIKSEVGRLNELVEKILFWGKVESGKISTAKEVINVVDLLQNVCAEHNRIQADGRKIAMRIKGNPVLILIDPMHLRHILGNLMSNAFKYSSGKTNPELNIEFAKKNWKITVIDQGIGIPESEVVHLFQSFFRASNVEHIHGNGLGMVVVKHFVEMNDGLLKVDSKENAGTKISIAFPY